MLIHTRQSVFHKEVRNKSKFISQIGICIFINTKSEISVLVLVLVPKRRDEECEEEQDTFRKKR